MESLEKLIKLHQYNFKNLTVKRGLSPVNQWQSGEIRKAHLIQTLQRYLVNTGLLLYTYDNGELIINLINRNGETLEKKLNIARQELIEKINKTNQYFASDFSSRSPKKRGVVLRKEVKKVSSKEDYEFLCKQLLPFSIENFGHLIIVPTLNIGTLPFSAFKISETEYLVDKVSYSLAPSIYELLVSELMNNEFIADQHENNFITSQYDYHLNLKNCLFIANPKYPQHTEWSFPNLPGTLKEVDYIKENLKPTTLKVLQSDKATYENIMSGICSYDLLYFGTHGISDNKNPLDNSFLVIAEEGGKQFITAREIQDIRLSCQLGAKLVVLSACETGLGLEHEGGIIGLARAFQIAGANHIMMSLWSINDEETAELIKLFFKYLKEGGRMLPHEAMRQAILEYKSVKNNPNYWASFSIFGTPMATFSPNKSRPFESKDGVNANLIKQWNSILSIQNLKSKLNDNTEIRLWGEKIKSLESESLTIKYSNPIPLELEIKKIAGQNVYISLVYLGKDYSIINLLPNPVLLEDSNWVDIANNIDLMLNEDEEESIEILKIFISTYPIDISNQQGISKGGEQFRYSVKNTLEKISDWVALTIKIQLNRI